MTKVIEIVEEGEVVTVTEAVKEESASSNSLMIIISAACVGVLVVAIGFFTVRYFKNKNGKQNGTHEKDMAAAVKTDIINVEGFEPQFVMEADDSKNIFGRPSTAPLGMDIERSEQKKPRKKTKGKKLVIRKRKTPNSGSSDLNPLEEGKQEDEDSIDDGFRNHSSKGRDMLSSPNTSQSKFFN